MIYDYYNKHFSYAINELMEKIYNAKMQRLDSVDIRGYSKEDIEKVIVLYQIVYPDSYDLHLQACLYNNIELRLTYHDCDDYLFNDKFNEMLMDIQTKIPYTATNYDIVKIVYDYLTTNISYNYDALPAYNKLKLDHKKSEDNQAELIRYLNTYGPSFTIYGPVVNRKGVCQGISLLFKYILNTFNIDSVVINGYLARNGNATQTGHAINLVEVDGEQAFVDITNGLHNSSTLNITMYDAFMVNEEEILKIFKPAFDEYTFENISSNLTYYNHYNLIINSIDGLRSKLSKIIMKAPEQVIYLQYSGNALNHAKLVQLINEVVKSKLTYDLIYDQPVIKGGNITIKIHKRRKRR